MVLRIHDKANLQSERMFSVFQCLSRLFLNVLLLCAVTTCLGKLLHNFITLKIIHFRDVITDDVFLNRWCSLNGLLRHSSGCSASRTFVHQTPGR